MLGNRSHCDKSKNKKIARRNDKMSKILNFLVLEMKYFLFDEKKNECK